MTGIGPAAGPARPAAAAPDQDADSPGLRPALRPALRLWGVVAVFFVIALAESLRLGIPLRDPGGKFLGLRLVLVAVLFGVLLLVDGAVRARRRPGGFRFGLVLPEIAARWTLRRVALAWAALLAYHATYFTYHNLKSWNAFNPPRDPLLLRGDRWLFWGHDPAVVLHEMLGERVATWVLMVWYEAFPTLVVLAVPAAVVLARRLSDAYAATAALVWAWILGTASYYAIPSLGPFHSAPEQFAGLPHTVIQETQARYLAERAHLLADPSAPDAVAQIAAFASLHVAITGVILGIAWWHRLRRTSVALAVFLAGTCVATVYLGWHYAVDDVAGLAIAGLSWWLGPRTVGVRRPAAAGSPPPEQGRSEPDADRHVAVADLP